jgi:hypothetical protein
LAVSPLKLGYRVPCRRERFPLAGDTGDGDRIALWCDVPCIFVAVATLRWLGRVVDPPAQVIGEQVGRPQCQRAAHCIERAASMTVHKYSPVVADADRQGGISVLM